MTGFRSYKDSTSKRVLNLLKAGYLRLREVAVKRITVVKIGENDGGGSDIDCRGIEVRSDTAKFTNTTL